MKKSDASSLFTIFYYLNAWQKSVNSSTSILFVRINICTICHTLFTTFTNIIYVVSCCVVSWCGVVWYGMVWRGVAWRGVVSCGVVW